MGRENKKFWSNGYTFLIYFSILFTLVAFSSAEATTSVTLTPNSLPANVPSTMELTADTASSGNTVWVDLFIDADKDGIIDPEEAKVEESFPLTDGIDPPKIAGVTNTNVNGDEDGTVDSSITTTLKFYDPPNPAGQFIIQVTDEDLSHAEAIFTFTQAATSQSISGTVTCDGSPVAGAIVEVESSNIDDCEVGEVITDQDGDYQIYLEDPGTYSVYVCAQGYLGKEIDGGSELDCIIVDGHETGKDLKLFNGDRHITGTIKDKDTNQGIGGVWVEAYIENGIEYSSESVTDHDGNFDIVVIDGTWELGIDEDDLQAKGYVGTDPNDVIVAGSNVSGQDVSLPPVTALITGTVKDEGTNPVSAWVEAETEIEGVEYFSETVTDPSGNYILGVIAGDWGVEAYPSCEPYLLGPPEQYISIADGQVKTHNNFICAQAGAISGSVRDSNNQPIEGLWVHVFDNACGGNWLGGDHTDKNGNYTIRGLPAGDCYVQTCARCEGLNYIDEWWDNNDGNIQCEGAAPVSVTVGQTHSGIHFILNPGGSISGTVTDNNNQPIQGLCVHAFDNACGGNWLGATDTDSNGNYILCGLPAGNCFVQACARCDGLNYVDEWWDNNDGSIDCNEAASIPVTVGEVTPNKNFVLEPAGSISGIVKDAGNSPIEGMFVEACDNPCGPAHWFGGTCTDADGNYTLSGLPEGNLYVRARVCAECCSGMCAPYVLEWWDDADGTIDCNQAAPVNVITGQDTGNINFALEPGGSVSGTVTDSQDNPIPNIHVYGHAEPCGGYWLGGTNTDKNGNYTLAGLPVGNAYVTTCAHCSGLNYIDEWWDDNNGTTNCNEAAPVSVPLNSTHENINFTLTPLKPIDVGQTTIDHNWKTVILSSTHQNAVCILGPPTYHGTDPGVVRVRNVTNNSFDIRFQEWLYKDGAHTQENIPYLVISDGRYEMPNGNIREAGTFSLSGTGDWTAHTFTGEFPSTPALFLTAQTYNGSDPITVRARNVTNTGFEAALFEEENKMDGHVTEEVGYLAVYSPRLSGKAYLVQAQSVDHRFMPVLSSDIKLEEEQSKDSEVSHIDETVFILALGDKIFAQDISSNGGDTIAIRRLAPEYNAAMEWGTVDGVDHNWMKIPLAKEYLNPVVVAKPVSSRGGDPGVIRIRNVSHNSFELRYNEWAYLDGWHTQERVFYMVVEAGIRSVAGLTVEAKRLNSSKLLADGWESINFSASFSETPSVFTSVQTYNGADPVTTRLSNCISVGFDLTMDEEEAKNDGHTTENIGWIAIEKGAGSTADNRSVKVFGDLTSHIPTPINFGQSMARRFPVVVSDITTTNGSDPCFLRYQDLGPSSIDLFIQEEASSDAEMNHTTEDVSVFVGE